MTSVSQVLVGLNRIGLIGLQHALDIADASGLEDREAIVALMMEVLGERNYISPASTDAYRQALWREYLRRRGEDIRDLYSEIEVVVRARPGPERDGFLQTLVDVFGRHELKPVVTLEAPSAPHPEPQLCIGDEVVAAGTTDPDRIARGIARRISHW